MAASWQSPATAAPQRGQQQKQGQGQGQAGQDIPHEKGIPVLPQNVPQPSGVFVPSKVAVMDTESYERLQVERRQKEAGRAMDGTHHVQRKRPREEKKAAASTEGSIPAGKTESFLQSPGVQSPGAVHSI